MRAIKRFANWLRELVRDYYPFFVCVTGGGLFHAGILMSDLYMKIFFWAVAFAAWLFALDLIAVRATAKATNDCAVKYLNFLTSGESSEINVYIHNKRD
ncbi:hypothetical protein [Ochrobactrum sp. S1502_03]|uniref:hypothetical protein n=1 Tax=Ochrobactrum sp. S1502_03 TaxID=3108451 RepID=UPI0037C8622B